jgi:simple sugar transport system permease protein
MPTVDPKSKPNITHLGFRFLGVIIALGFTMLLLILTDAPPLEAFQQIFLGAFGKWKRFADVLVAFVPLLLATAGLLFTYTTGLWNIGIEGQIAFGAIFTTGALRIMQDTTLPIPFILTLAIVAGALGGMLWALLAGVLRVFGGVNEIFGGLGLNFVATSVVIWLIFGPWKRPGVASMSGTDTFDKSLWLPMISGTRLSLVALIIGIVAIFLTWFLIKKVYFGIKLKAVGHNPKAADLSGVSSVKYMLLAFIFCGIFAGLAGALQVTAVYHRLIPSISSGYGYTGMMVAMLVNFQPLLVTPIALFFAILNIGSIQLPIVLKLDSNLSGVLQGALVLFVLLAEGVREKIAGRNN